MDSRPRAYESPALPLSYLGVVKAGQILLWEGAFVNVRLEISAIPNLNPFATDLHRLTRIKIKKSVNIRSISVIRVPFLPHIVKAIIALAV